MYHKCRILKEVSNLKPGDIIEIITDEQNFISKCFEIEDICLISPYCSITSGYTVPHLETTFTDGSMIVVPQYNCFRKLYGR